MKLKQSALKETLDLAEQEHWLDCPNAGWAMRLASLTLDAIFIYIFVHFLGRLVDTIHFHKGANLENDLYFALGLAEFSLRVGFVFLYLVVSSHLWGSTLGKFLLGLRLVDEKTGGTLSIARVCTRLFWGLAANFLTVLVLIVRPDHRSLHDLLTNSIVKRTRGRH